MDLGARRFILLADRRACADETTTWRRYVDHRLALLRVVRGLFQVQFPDPKERFAFFVLCRQARAKCERCNQYTQRFPGHFTLLTRICSLGYGRGSRIDCKGRGRAIGPVKKLTTAKTVKCRMSVVRCPMNL